MRRRYALLASVCVLALVGAACQQQPAAERETVRLAFVGAQTGPFNPLVIHAIKAAQLAVEEANEAGDLDVIVELVVFDTQASPDQATTLKDRFIPDESFIGVVGPAFSGETRAILPSLQEAGLVIVSPSATAVALPNVICGADATECPEQTVFHRVVPNDDVQAEALTDYVTKVLQLTNLAYGHDNTDYGKGVAEGTRDLLSGAGVTAATTVTVDPASQDYSAAVNQILGSGAQGVFYGGYHPEAGRLLRQLRDAGYTGRFIGPDGALTSAFVTAAGAAAAEGAVITCACRLASEATGGDLGDFATRYRAMHNEDPGVYAGEGYDSAQIFIEGIRNGHTTRQAMHDYVESLTTVEFAISKEVEFLPNGDQAPRPVFIHEVRNGTIVVLGTVEELAG